MTTPYSHAVSTFAGLPAETEPCLGKLTLEVAGSAITTNLDRIDRKIVSSVDTVIFEFESALSGGDETILNGIVSGHDGGLVNTQYHASSKVVNDEKQITEVGSWQVLGGVMTNPSYFVDDLTRTLGRIVAMIKTTGTTVELRLTEDDALIGSVKVLDDTSGAWAKLTWTTSGGVQGGDREYKLEGRLVDGGNSAYIRHAALSLLELT